MKISAIKNFAQKFTTFNAGKDIKEIIPKFQRNKIAEKAFKTKVKLRSKKFVPVAKKLSDYSAHSTSHEIYTELYAKKLVEGLNDKEQALFNYLS